MLIPNIPTPQQELIEAVKNPDGSMRYMMHPAWHNFLSQLTIELQNNASQEGIVIPQQSTTNIASLNVNKFGAMVYDNTTNLAKININGIFRTITTS